MSGLAARPEISITVPQTPSPANKTEDENETALSEMAGLFVLWLAQGCGRCRIASGGIETEAGMREMPDSIRRNGRNRPARMRGGGTEGRNGGDVGDGTERQRPQEKRLA